MLEDKIKTTQKAKDNKTRTRTEQLKTVVITLSNFYLTQSNIFKTVELAYHCFNKEFC